MVQREGIAPQFARIHEEVEMLSREVSEYARLCELLEERVEHLESLTLGSRDNKKERERWKRERAERRRKKTGYGPDETRNP